MLNFVKRFQSKVFVRGLPTDWDHAEMIQRFGSVGPISQVFFVKNQQGQNTGKAILTYEEEQAGAKCIARFDNSPGEYEIIRVKPYFTKGQERPRTSEELIARRAYLMNVPYDASEKELE